MTIGRVNACIAALAATAVGGAIAGPGSLDPTFGNGGIARAIGAPVTISFPSIALAADGKVVVAGSDTTTTLVARFTAAGQLDATFGTGGYVTYPAGFMRGLVVQPSGRIVVLSDTSFAQSLFAFRPDGAPDPTFGANGVAPVPLAFLTGLALQPDGSIVVAGREGDTNEASLRRFSVDGAADGSFGPSRTGTLATMAGIAVMPDGRIVGAGTISLGLLTQSVFLSRWTADGAVEPATGGAKLTTVNGPAVSSLAVLPDGRVFVGATDTLGPFSSRGRLRRYTAALKLDSTFPPPGYFELSAGDVSSIGRLAAQPDGRVIVAGSVGIGMPFFGQVTYTPRLLRITSSGTQDATFVADPALATFSPSAMAIQPDGKLVAASGTGGLAVVRVRLVDDVAYDDPAGDADGDGIPNDAEFALGRDPSTKDNDLFADARLFAMQQYRDFLSREGDAGGITAWTNEITAGRLSRGQVIERFFNSQEFQGTISPVTRLYFAYFMRIPDYAGLTFWIGQSRKGTRLDAISQAFSGSPEFSDRYGALDNGAFVELVYNNVLGRAPDTGGKQYWQGQLDAGQMTRGQVMLGFSESSEYRGASLDKVYVTMMYVGMLRRAPDQGGFDFWVGYRNRGNSGLALIDGFLAAPEYRGRFLP